MVHVNFVAVPELLVDPSGELKDIDRNYLAFHVKHLGFGKFKYSFKEHVALRNLAERANASKKFINEFDRTYNFLYWMTIRARHNKINSIGGMCWDVAIKNYADYAETIEKESAKRGRR